MAKLIDRLIEVIADKQEEINNAIDRRFDQLERRAPSSYMIVSRFSKVAGRLMNPVGRALKGVGKTISNED